MASLTQIMQYLYGFTSKNHLQALHYDVRRGPHSVGSHVRDAAAYVCWAFGRAYYHKDMKNVLDQLAPDLLIVGSFDREVLVTLLTIICFCRFLVG